MSALTFTANDRAGAYLAQFPGAVQGQGGDHHTYKACCVLVNDFGLSEAEAWPLLLEWNRSCVPPWKEADLRVKLRSALRCPHPRPRGNKLEPANPRFLQPAVLSSTTHHNKPDLAGFGPGTLGQLKRLAESRPYGLEGLSWATDRGLLVFGRWCGHDVYGVTDASQHVLEIRRIDGKPFPATNDLRERKSHAVRGSDKHWPVGILEAKEFPAIALVEGIPDLLEAHNLALWEQASDNGKRDVYCAPVAMLSASPGISDDALSGFIGKRIRIFPHADHSGQKAGKRWAKQLHGVALKVELFNFAGLRRINGEPVNDLYDCRELDPTEYLNDHNLWKLLP